MVSMSGRQRARWKERQEHTLVRCWGGAPLHLPCRRTGTELFPSSAEGKQDRHDQRGFRCCFPSALNPKP